MESHPQMAGVMSDQDAAGSSGIYRSLFEGSPQPILVVERDSLQVLKANDAAATQYGYAAAELVDLPLERLWPGAREGLLRNGVGEHVRRDGSPFAACVAARELAFPGRGALALHITDVDEERFSAAFLKAHVRLLEMVARGSPIGAVLDALVREMEALSSGMLASVLLLDEDGRHARHGAAPSLPPDYWRAIDGLVIGPASGSCGTAMYRELPVAVHDIATDPLWTDYRAIALAHGLRACWSIPIRSSAGKVLGAFAVYYREPAAPRARDQRLVELATALATVALECERRSRALIESETRLWAFLDHAFALVSLKDRDGRYVLVNRRFEQSSGIPAAVARGRSDAQLFPSALALAYSAHDDEVLQSLTGIEFEHDLAQRDGSHTYLAAKFALQHPAGEPYGIGAILLDITERKQGLRALDRAREEERTRLSREIHDQLGQMLASLSMNHALFARSLRQRLPDQEWAAAEIDNLQKSVAATLDVVRDIAMDLRPGAIEKFGLAGALRWQAEEFAKRTGIACRVALPQAAPSLDAGQGSALFRILQEALANVALHSGASEVRIELQADAERVEMSVTDNGRGIEARADSPTLGLLGMRERAGSLGGTATIAAAPGGGTRVTVRIPAH